jgi:hypothetical protein
MHEYETCKAVSKVHERLRAMHILELSHDEGYRLFADAETRNLLTKAKDVGLMSLRWALPFNWSLTFNGQPLELALSFSFLGFGHPLLPRCPILQDEPELIARVEEWLRGTLEVDVACGRLLKVVKMLHQRCENYRQLRYLFPGILPLLDMAGQTSTAAKVRAPASKPPTGTPTLTPVEREHVRRAGVTVNMALLLPDPEAHDPMANTVKIAVPSIHADLPEGGWVQSMTV